MTAKRGGKDMTRCQPLLDLLISSYDAAVCFGLYPRYDGFGAMTVLFGFHALLLVPALTLVSLIRRLPLLNFQRHPPSTSPGFTLNNQKGCTFFKRHLTLASIRSITS